MRVLAERRKIVQHVAKEIVASGTTSLNKGQLIAELGEVLAEENQSVARATKATKSVTVTQKYRKQQSKVVERGTNRVNSLQYAIDMLAYGDRTMTLKHLHDYDLWCSSNAPTEVKELPTHEAAYEEYSLWKLKQKQQDDMKDPKFRTYLSKVNPQLAHRLDEEQPLKKRSNDYSRG